VDNRQKWILVAAALILLAMILFPPYFGVDRESGGRLHAFIGHHPIWDPPPASYVYQRLSSGDPGSSAPADLSSFEARVNVVRLARNIALLGVAALLAKIVLGRLSRRV
jgi:hypothetical protein